MFGNRLAEERKRLGLTQKDLANLLGVGRSAVAMIEIGKSGLEGTRVASLRSSGFDLEYLLCGERESHRAVKVVDWDLVLAIIERLNDRCRRKKIRLTRKKVKSIVTHVYLQLIEQEVVDEATLDRILRIAA